MKKEDIIKRIVDFLHIEDNSSQLNKDDEEILMYDEFQTY